MMKILILNPPFLKKFSRPQRSPAVTKSGTLYYPIWLAYATGVLEKEGFEVKLIDAPAEGYEMKEVFALLEGWEPDLAVLDTSTPSIYNDILVAEDIKGIYPRAFLALVGTHVSALPEESLKLSSGVNAVARGEYDYTLPDLAHALQSKRDLQQVEGISFQEDGKVIHNPDRPYIEELDEIPFVSQVIKKHLKVEHYFNPNALYPQITIITGRGCVHRCIFCLFPQTLHGRRYRYRSVENVVEEFEFIRDEFPQVRAIFIEDDTLTVKRKRCLQLCERLIEKKIEISWTANSRADLDLTTMKRMKEAGCRCLCVGFESGDQEVLDNMHKGITVESSRRFAREAKEAGILVHGCFIFGNPGETRESIQRTLKMAMSLPLETAQFYPIMVYPGTEGYSWAKQSGYLTMEDFSRWVTEEGLHNCVVSTPQLSARELVRFCDHARRAFYLRPSYILYKTLQMGRSPREVRRTVKSFKTFFKYLLRGSFASENRAR